MRKSRSSALVYLYVRLKNLLGLQFFFFFLLYRKMAAVVDV